MYALSNIFILFLFSFQILGFVAAKKFLVQLEGRFVKFVVPLYTDGVIQQCESEYLEIVNLPKVFYKRYGSIPSRIYIRHCYRKLYEIVTNLMETYEKPFPAALFTGVPGIGKSLFLIYFLFMFLRDDRFPDKRFALEFVSGKYHYFEPNIETGGFYRSKENAESCPVLEIPIFSDVMDITEPRCRGKWLFIFSSPNLSRCKKISPKFRYILPTWSYFELLCIQPDDRQWIDHFILFGGVPRSIIWDGIEENPAIKLEDALESKGGIIADYFFKHGFGNVDTEKSYMLLHMNPPWSPTDNDWQYNCHAVHSFASDAIFKRIAEKHQIRLLAEPINLFNAGVAPEVYGGGSAGNLFEKICLWLKPIAGHQISAQSLLEPLRSFHIVLPAMGLLEYHWKENARDNELKKLLPGVLYQPKISNLESGDAFCLVPYERDQDIFYLLVVLQFTVGEKHPIKINGLNDIVLAFPESLRKRIVDKLFVFVTPPEGKLNKVQPLHTQNNKVAENIPLLVQGFIQCVYRHSV